MQQDSFCLSEAVSRLDKALSLRYPDHSRQYFQYLIQEGLVLVNGHLAKKSTPLTEEDEVEVTFAPLPEISLQPEAIPLDILFEDEHLIAINKPAGMVVHPACGNWSGTFVNALLYHCRSLPHSGSIRPGIVHRLDKETSGVLLAAKTEQTQQKLIESFATRQIEKKYVAICIGNPGCRWIEGAVGRHPVHRQKMALLQTGGRSARTYCHVLAHAACPPSKQGLSLLSLTPETGRTHQLRVHLQSIGTPILGDPLYGLPSLNQKWHVTGQLLHAHALRFRHPHSHALIEIVAPLPEAMRTRVDQLFPDCGSPLW